jgi:hypothetical protein
MLVLPLLIVIVLLLPPLLTVHGKLESTSDPTKFDESKKLSSFASSTDDAVIATYLYFL